MLPLKNDFTYAILDDEGRAVPGAVPAAGLYRHDTRHLSRYAWTFGELQLIDSRATSRTLTQYWSRMERHAQVLLLERRLELGPAGFVEHLRVENATDRSLSLAIALDLEADFADIFAVRWGRPGQMPQPVPLIGNAFSYAARDGIVSRTQIDFGGLDLRRPLELPPHAVRTFVVSMAFESTLPAAASTPAEAPRWSPVLDIEALPAEERPVVRQAIADIASLLLATPEGTTIAAGIPNFVAPFGRDSLITAWLLLPVDPGLARGVLTHLAAKQGTREDTFRDEQPGKIMHEHRESELSRLGELPFRTYYGSADATPLFVVVLAAYVLQTGDIDLARALETNWRAALAWIERYADERGLVCFHQRGDGKGLTVQSWKDSSDSMSYRDGGLGEGALAVAEVQGYVFAAWHAAAELSAHCGGSDSEQADFRARAAALAARVDALYWMEEEGTYALALDAQARQLDVVASDAGHMLWSGIVPAGKAARVRARLFAPDLWSGYGLRTLGTGEKRYNPLSYHNGSVWPHDTALFAAGLLRYGDRAGFGRVREALVALAGQSADLRLPELVGGYAREGGIPPLPYHESCRPQAWAAAALLYMVSADAS